MPWSQPTSKSEPAPVRAWRAELALSFRRDRRRTTLTDRRHVGPLGVQQPFYPEADGTCHVYLLHPPGGIAGGDALSISAQLSSNARALLTTPAATKLYRTSSRTDCAGQRQTLRVAKGAFVEWLPQETIVFDGAHADLSTRVELADGADFIGWEVLCLGRPAAGERFTRGRLRQAFEIEREGRPLFIERALYEGESPVLQAPWGLDGQPVVGTMVCVTHAIDGLVERLRAALSGIASPAQLSVSQLRDALVCRYLGPRADVALTGFRAAWAIVRETAHQRAPSAPRIWLT